VHGIADQSEVIAKRPFYIADTQVVCMWYIVIPVCIIDDKITRMHCGVFERERYIPLPCSVRLEVSRCFQIHCSVNHPTWIASRKMDDDRALASVVTSELTPVACLWSGFGAAYDNIIAVVRPYVNPSTTYTFSQRRPICEYPADRWSQCSAHGFIYAWASIEGKRFFRIFYHLSLYQPTEMTL